MKLKNKYKKIFLLLVIMLVAGLLLSNAYAAITADKNGNVDVNVSDVTKWSSVLNNILTELFGIGISGLLLPITYLITLLSVVLFNILWMIFMVGTGNGGPNAIEYLPFPDQIIFNRNPFFDANFINPAETSLISNFGDILKNLFESFQTIAIAVFVVSAMVAGIRMALSTIASKKAQYKEAALKWVTGLVILFCLKVIIAGIFYVNEYIVATLYSVASEVSVPIYIVQIATGVISGGSLALAPVLAPFVAPIITIAGSALNSLLIGADVAPTLYVDGYLGIALANIVRAVSGDIISSIIGFIIIGQAMTVIGSYLKRMFMCMFLGAISPLIVAADVVVSTTGMNSTIFKNWLKNFSLTVFMQSIHAAYLVIAFSIIGKLYSSSAVHAVASESTGLPSLNIFQVDIVVIVLMTGLVKLEKMIKTLFGIGDSFAGNLKEGAKSMVKAMGAVRGLKEGIAAVTDNRKKADDAGKRRRALEKAIIDKENALKASKDTTVNNISQTTTNNNTGGNKNPSGDGEGTGSKKKSKSSADFIEDVIKEYNGNMTPEEEIAALKKARDKEIRKQNAGRLAQIMAVPNLAAGFGIGLGMDDEISESLFKGGYITKGLDWATEKVGSNATRAVKVIRDIEVEYNVKKTFKDNGRDIPNSEVRKMVKNLDRTQNIDDI